MTAPRTIGVGLYGDNGHQIQDLLSSHPLTTWVAAAEIEKVPEGVRTYSSLVDLLADPDVELVSICSPLRKDQGEDILRSLNAGKATYAEKPCCLDEENLDLILETAQQTGTPFHEMAGTAWEPPYAQVREVVASGVLGDILQVFAQKSYPWADWRPKNEAIDGGLSTQVGVYATRFVEHVAGERIQSIALQETTLGNEIPDSDCKRAASFLMTLENGGVASAIINYACPDTWNRWGYETLRIFGTNGFIESIDYGRICTLALNGKAPQTLPPPTSGPDFFTLYLEELIHGDVRIHLSLEEELSPTRWVLRAKAC